MDKQKTDKIKKDIKSLTKFELNILFQELFDNNIIDFTYLAMMYTEYLKSQRQSYRMRINSMTIPLMHYLDHAKLNKKSKQTNFIRAKTAYNIIRSGWVKGTEGEKEYQKIVDKFKYSEDENNGHHTFTDVK